jgi:hypothetical protein
VPVLPVNSRICDGEVSAFLSGNTRRLRYVCTVTHRQRRRIDLADDAAPAQFVADPDQEKSPAVDPDRDGDPSPPPRPEREPESDEDGKPSIPLRLVSRTDPPAVESTRPKRQRRSA